MLPARLLDVVEDGGLLCPRWLGTQDRAWVEALADRVQSLVGRARGEVEQVMSEFVLPEAPTLARRAMTLVLLRRHGFAIKAPVRPARVREIVFPLSAERPGSSRGQLLCEAGRRLGLSAEEVGLSLHADRPRFRRLEPLEGALSVDDLVEHYHLALAQGLLLRAYLVRARLAEQVRPVVRFARLQGLMVSLSSAPARRAVIELELSGPLSLFRHATRYGRALARWLPALTRAPRWSLEARCVLDGRTSTLRLSHRDPLGTTHAPPRRFDSALEERLFRNLQELASGWRVLREGRPVRAGGRLAFPDFVLVHEASSTAVPVEVVGFWTPEYLAEKLRVLAALPESEPWLTCVDERLAVAAEGQLPAAGLLRFKGSVDAAALLRAAEELLAQRPKADKDRALFVREGLAP